MLTNSNENWYESAPSKYKKSCQSGFLFLLFWLSIARQNCENLKMAKVGGFRPINSAKMKNSKIHSDNFFYIPKTYPHAHFQANW